MFVIISEGAQNPNIFSLIWHEARKTKNKQKASHFRSFNQNKSDFSVVKTVVAAVDGYFRSTQHVTQSYVNFLVHQVV